MRILTVKQPWAWALVNGPKRIENRSWPTSYRGPLLIHAGVSRSDLFAAQDFDDFPGTSEYLFGYLIGIVDLIACVQLAEVAGQPFAEGPWCWVTRNPRPLTTPIACRGNLGLWRPTPEILKASESDLHRYFPIGYRAC